MNKRQKVRALINIIDECTAVLPYVNETCFLCHYLTRGNRTVGIIYSIIRGIDKYYKRPPQVDPRTSLATVFYGFGKRGYVEYGTKEWKNIRIELLTLIIEQCQVLIKELKQQP